MRLRTFSICALVLLVLGFTVGYFFLSALLQPAGALKAPSLSDPPVPAIATDDTGWCCQAPGASCVPDESPQICLGNGGQVYTKIRSECDQLCAALSAIGSP